MAAVAASAQQLRVAECPKIPATIDLPNDHLSEALISPLLSLKKRSKAPCPAVLQHVRHSPTTRSMKRRRDNELPEVEVRLKNQPLSPLKCCKLVHQRVRSLRSDLPPTPTDNIDPTETQEDDGRSKPAVAGEDRRNTECASSSDPQEGCSTNQACGQASNGKNGLGSGGQGDNGPRRSGRTINARRRHSWFARALEKKCDCQGPGCSHETSRAKTLVTHGWVCKWCHRGPMCSDCRRRIQSRNDKGWHPLCLTDREKEKMRKEAEELKKGGEGGK
jgi:hypothetical protein